MIQNADEVVNVLLITGDPDLAATLGVMLGLDGYDVTVVDPDPDNRRPLPAARCRPDLVYVDLRLPLEESPGLLRRVRAHPWVKNVPAVILSCHSSNDLAARGVRLGPLEHLVMVDSRFASGRRPFGAALTVAAYA